MSHLARPAVVLAILAVSTVAAVAQGPADTPSGPPTINIPEGLRSGDLLTNHERQVTQRFEYYLKRLAVTSLTEEIVENGSRLLEIYMWYPEPAYRQQVAEMFVELAEPYISGQAYPKDDELAMVRRINVAMAASKMESRATQPLLEVMIQSKNPAIRFFGWKGYGNIRLPLLSGQVNRTLLASLETALAEETSGVVLSEVFRVVNVSPSDLIAVNAGARAEIARQFMPLIAAVWDARLEQMRKAQALEYVTALEAGVNALATYKGDDIAPKACERVYKTAVTAAAEYIKANEMKDEIIEAGDVEDLDEAAKVNQLDARSKAMLTLIRACEQALNDLVPGLSVPSVDETIRKFPTTPGAAVLLLMKEDWKQALTDAKMLAPTGDAGA